MLVFRSFATGQGRGTPRAKHATAACGPPRTPTRRPWPLVWDAPEARGVGHAVTNACHPPITRIRCQVIQRVVWLSLRAAAALGLRGSSVGRAPSDRRPPTADDVDADPLSGPGVATPTARACIGRTRQPTLALRPASDTHPAASRAV